MAGERTVVKKLRTAVIGLGMGSGHAKRFREHPGVDLTALADTDQARLAALGKELGVSSLYTSGKEMLKKEKLDVVCVATPNKFHKPLTIAALKAGCHVLCEKPMAMNAAEGRAMLAAAKAAKRRLMINFSFRFTPQSQAMKAEVDSGTLGDIYFARTLWLRRRGMPGFGGWFGQKALAGGGPLIDLGVHRLDLALWLMGHPKPKWVLAGVYDRIASALARKSRKAFDVEDFAAGFIQFENGATLEIEASWAANIKERELMETRLLGSKGGLLQRNLNEGYELETEVFIERNGRQYDLHPHAPLPAASSSMAHFIDCIAEDRPHMATGEEGLLVMQLLDALYASAAQGRPVEIAR